MMYEEILNYVGKNLASLHEFPQILCNYYLILLLTKKDEKYFNKLKQLKAVNFESLPETDKQNFFIIMANYCREMSLAGKENFRKERFELDKEYFALIKHIPQKRHAFFFITAAKNANRINEFEWVEKNVKEFELYSLDDNKDYMINYIKADTCFYKKEYDDAIFYLSKIKSQYSSQKQNIRNLLFRIYFETSSFEAALSLIDTSKHFLKRDRHMVQLSKLSSFNFITLTEKLIYLKLKGNKKEILFLKKKIAEINEILDKDWLLEKISVQ